MLPDTRNLLATPKPLGGGGTPETYLFDFLYKYIRITIICEN